MNLRNKGVLYVLIGAAAAGVYLEVKRHEREGTLYGPVASGSASVPKAPTASGSSSAPPPQIQGASQLSRKQVEALHEGLGKAVRAGASDSGSPWALAHGLIAFGKDFKASDGEGAVDAIGKQLVREKGPDGKPVWSFPPGSVVAPTEPHPHLIADVLLQVGVDPKRDLVTQNGSKISVQTLVDEALARAKDPESESDWIDSPWLLDLLTRAGSEKARERAKHLAPLAWQQLSKETQLIADYRGAPAQAFANGSPLFAAKRDKTQIYGHHCGGLHFMQAALSLEALSKTENVAPELDRLLKRIALERSTYNALQSATQGTPQARLLWVQELKFFGHSAETLGLARELKLYEPASSEGQRLDAALRALAWDLNRVFEALQRDGAYSALDSIKQERPQTYLDLIGDGCHAMRGLQRALAVFPETQP